MAYRKLSDAQFLVVDDEQFSRAIVVRILRKLGADQIRQAVDGQDALVSLRWLGRVDCVFLDFNMPNLNGLQLLKAIRDGSAGVDRGIPVAMLTGHSDLGLVRTAMALDVAAFLQKPASANTIIDKLSRILSQGQELADAEVYAGVEVPTRVLLSDEVGQAPPPPRSTMIAVPGRPHLVGVRLRLEQITPGARLARRVIGPDGKELLPESTVLSQRLLSLLHDLRAFDDCIAELWIERAVLAPRSEGCDD